MTPEEANLANLKPSNQFERSGDEFLEIAQFAFYYSMDQMQVDFQVIVDKDIAQPGH